MDRARIQEILRPGTADEQEDKEKTVRASFFDKVRQNLKRIPFMEDVVASYYCATDSRTPIASRAILFSALAYFIMPIDVIPDMFLFLGMTDDIAILLAAFKAVQGNIRPEHYDRARETLDGL
ncbi:YkvA family protein [Fulvimarina sp. 2208YS6-2-32]|uniref:YkvA family protein n=1 Tax=Fulvimarina uroteuthidis TaxID=3098149 RepID=UPI003A101F92